MPVRIYGVKNCDTMKKTVAWLEAHDIAYDFHDYKKAGVPPGKLKQWAAKAGWEKLVNWRGPTWRKIPDAEKADLDQGKALALLEKNTSAIKRPILEGAGGHLVVGFDPEELEKLR